MIIQPYLNPKSFYEIDPVVIPQYVSKHIDDYRFAERIFPWQQRVCGLQQWQINDRLPLQFMATQGVTYQLFSEDGALMHTVDFQQKQQNIDNPALFIYELNFYYQEFPAGYYYEVLTSGSKKYISNPFKLSENVENSLLLEYKNRVYKDGIFFETGIVLCKRVPGLLIYKDTDSTITEFVDQDEVAKTIKQTDFDIWTLSIGLSYGIPDEDIRIIKRAIGCTEFKADGRQYSRNAGAKWEESSHDNYPMKGHSIEVRSSLGRDSKMFNDDGTIDKDGMIVLISVENKGFDNQVGGSNFLIKDII